MRDRHELLYIAVRGKGLPAPAPGTQSDSIISIKKGKHSAKPEQFRKLIDDHYPGVGKIELFGRGTAPDGWIFWGDEAAETGDDSAVDADTGTTDDDANQLEPTPDGSPTEDPQDEPAEAGPETEPPDTATSTDCSDASPVETLEKPVPGNDETREPEDEGDGDDNEVEDRLKIPDHLDRRPKPEDKPTKSA